MSDDQAPGWDAITAACTRIHGDQEPLHWGTVIRWGMGGPDPLDGISAYRVEDPPHWHIVTYGMTELYRKESEDGEHSGWGFEFTVRLERKEGEQAPPNWVLNLLQNIGRYVFQSGNWFGPGHHMSLNGPIALGSDTAITAILFDEDPSLGTIDTPHGRVQFLQVLGVTDDERQAAIRWNGVSFAELVKQVDPHRIIALERPSVLDDTEICTRVDAGISRDGSSCGSLFGGKMEWSAGDPVVLSIGALQVKSVLAVLPGRIPFGHQLLVLGEDDAVLVFDPADANAAEVGDEGQLTISLTEQGARELVGAVEARRGRYSVDAVPGLVIEVRPTDIRDREGNVVDTVG